MDTVHGEARLRRPLMIAAAGVLVVAAALGLNHFLFDDQADGDEPGRGRAASRTRWRAGPGRRCGGR